MLSSGVLQSRGGLCVPSGARGEAPKRIHSPGPTCAVLAPCRALGAVPWIFGDSLLQGLAGRGWTHFPGELCRSALPWAFSSRPAFEPSASMQQTMDEGPPSLNHLPPAFSVPRDTHSNACCFPHGYLDRHEHTLMDSTPQLSLSLLNTRELRA